MCTDTGGCIMTLAVQAHTHQQHIHTCTVTHTHTDSHTLWLSISCANPQLCPHAYMFTLALTYLHVRTMTQARVHTPTHLPPLSL